MSEIKMCFGEHTKVCSPPALVRVVIADYVGHEGIHNTESTWHVSVEQKAYMFI